MDLNLVQHDKIALPRFLGSERNVNRANAVDPFSQELSSISPLLFAERIIEALGYISISRVCFNQPATWSNDCFSSPIHGLRAAKVEIGQSGAITRLADSIKYDSYSLLRN